MEHVSVLQKESIEYLDLKEGERVVDATLGLGGHAKKIVEKIGEKGHLFAFEQDERNLIEAKKRLKDYEKQITYIHDNFRYLKTRITGKIDAILFDLGLSSPHVDEADRGFSFQKEGPLDMRFDQRNDLTAAKVINEYSEEELVRIFFEYGEERMSRRIARMILERRKERKFETTTDLAEFLEGNLPKKRGMKNHSATKVFQALRIEVNDELSVLKEVLEQAIEVLEKGGRIVVISYHSLEDRIVKRFFKELEKPEEKDPEKRIYQNFSDPIVKKITRKPVIPSEAEIELNPRARSAKLRAYEKL
jgi:16S rRNA (cytosine1402-N4)-methyltransferase